MERSSRTLTLITFAGLVLVIAVWLMIRSANAPKAISFGDPSTPAPRESDTRLDPRLPRDEAIERQRVLSDPATTRDPAVAPARLVRGLVLDEATGKPIDRFEVVHSPAGVGAALVDSLFGFENPALAPSDAFEGTDGTFELDANDAEALSIASYAEGYERSEPVTAVPIDAIDPGSSTPTTIRLRRASIVDGRVVDSATGLPVEGALVAWIDAQGKARTGTRERFERTDAFGRFHLGSVPRSARRILAGREDLGEGLSEPLRLVVGETVPEIVIDLRRSGG